VRQETDRADTADGAADRDYGEQAVEDALHDLGVKPVMIPRNGRPGKPDKPTNDNQRSDDR
jgi:hypothetical protein